MNYNKYKLPIFYTGLCFLLMMGACKKSFIDGITPTNSASPKDVYASPDAVRIYFNGIYRVLRSQWQSTDGSAGGSTDAWGYNSVQMARDVKGIDVVMPYNSWYYFDYQDDNREPTYRRVKFTWYFFYELINQLNVLIDGTTKSATITDDEKTPLLAEARALRAWFHFELAREFCTAYAKDPNAKGIPYYTQPAADSSKGNPRGTLQQTFDKINEDIEYAVQNIGTDQLLKDQVNLNVAWGMAARIYLEQGKWAEAETAAHNARQDHTLDAANYPNNYQGSSASSSELLWSLPQTTENGGQSLYYGTPSSFFELDGNGYSAFWMSKTLVESFTLSDVRNTFYQYGNDINGPDAYGTNKYGTIEGSPFDIELLNGETVPFKTIDFNENLNMMRVGEMYLIEAEAKARQNEGDADDVLYALQKNRDASAVQSNATGQTLIDEILLERRKELYGELGIDWMDAKRLQLGIDRTTTNHPSPYDFKIPANDPKFTLKLPQSELQANKSMSNADQNP